MSDLIKNGGTLWELAKALVEQIHNQGGSDATARALISNDELMVRIAQLSVGPVWETERLAGFANPSTLEVNTAMSLLDLQTWVGGKVSVHPNQPEFSESRIERKYGLAIAHVPWSFTYDQELDAGGNGPGGWEHADYRDLLYFVEHFGAGALKPARLLSLPPPGQNAPDGGRGEPPPPPRRRPLWGGDPAAPRALRAWGNPSGAGPPSPPLPVPFPRGGEGNET